MPKPIQLRIPTPCHESWSNMEKTDCGRFCISCQKEVIDFSTMSDSEIFSHFSKGNGNTCGRLSLDQLNRNLSKQRERKLGWFRYFIHVMLPAMVLVNKSSAQGTVRKIVETVQSSPSKPVAQTFLEKGRRNTYRKKEKLKRIIWPTIANADGNGQSGTYHSPSNKDELQTIDPKLHLTDYSSDDDGDQTRHYLVGGLSVVKCFKIDTTFYQHIKNLFASNLFKDNETINIFPNPAFSGSMLNFRFENNRSANYLVFIFNMSGQLILERRIAVQDVKSVEHIQLNSNFVKGIYSVTITNLTTKKIFANKLVVE